MTESRAGALDRLRVALVIVGSIGQVLAGWLPELSGWEHSIASQSDSIDTPLTPAGYAFAIWAVLFLGCIAFAVFHALPAQRTSPVMRRIGWLAALAFLGNLMWSLYVPLFGLGVISLLIILLILAATLAIVLTVARAGSRLTSGQKLFVLPLLALAGWITAATTVSIGIAAVTTGTFPVDPIRPFAWALLLGLCGLLASAFAAYTRSIAYAVTFAWGAVAIFIANGAAVTNPIGATALLAGIACLAAALVGSGRVPRIRTAAG